MSVPEILDATWRAVPGNVSAARRVVAAHLQSANTPNPPLNDITLAVSEAATNAVTHAYRDREPGSMRLRVEIGGDEIELMVEDEGVGMSPRDDSPGLGLGIPVISQVADRYDVRRTRRGGTRLCMWFKTNSTAR